MESSASPVPRRRPIQIALGVVLLLGLGATAWFTRPYWQPRLEAALHRPASKSAGEHAEVGHAGQGHAGHDHGHDHAAEANSIVISDQARQNLGLKIAAVEPQEFWKHISVPGQVVNLPGRSERAINAAVQGTILKVHVLQGQTVRPGDVLFEIQLTGELLASAQSNLLRILQDLELNEAEIKRIAPVGEAGAVSQKLVLEKQYEKRRLESARQVQLQELTLRGLSPVQISTIIVEKKLVRQFAVKVPEVAAEPEKKGGATPEDLVFIIEKLDVFPGKLVNPGDELCDLALHSVLQLRGEAFETDSAQVYRAIEERWPVSAIFELGGEPLVKKDLHILYASSVTDPQARSFDFFLPLVNEVIRDQIADDGRSFRSWRFKPGQKVQLLVPVEKWTDRFVVPADAVVSEGAESFVFKVNGKKLERQAVVIEYRDSRQAVLANDGSVFPGDQLAMNQAYSLNLALKKASGSGVDLHAGHNH